MNEEPKKSKLRELYAYKSKLIQKLEGLIKNRNVVNIQIEDVNGKISNVSKKIDYIEDRKLLMTSHFVERYRERVGPETIQEVDIYNNVATPQLINMINTLGNGGYPCEKLPGYTLIIQDNKLITINPPLSREKPLFKKIKPQSRVKPHKSNKKWN